MRNEREYLIVNNRNLMDFGVYLFGDIPHVMPRRDIEKISIPGRNGELTIDNDRWENVEITYQLVMLGDGDKRIDELMGFLISLIGSVKIEDSREPNYYRMGRLVEMPNWRAAREAGTLKITFECRPEKWFADSQSVDIRYTSTNGIDIINPTQYDASPLILVRKNSQSRESIYIYNYMDDEDISYHAQQAAYTIDISADANNIDIWIDCETGESYYYTSSAIVACNQYISFSHFSAYNLRVSEFPKITGNKNWLWNYNPLSPDITVNTKHVNSKAYTRITTHGLTKGVLYPRWWTL